jgi:hypothetical protein
MSNITLDLFEDDLGVPEIPARSTLYHCPILGPGTSLQESLLNYVHRLARAHQLRVMDLLVHVVLPVTQVTVHCGRFRFASKDAKTVNGYGKYASEVSAALESLTGMTDLKQLTFLHWGGLFDGKGAGLLHPTRTWCPDCLAESEERGEPHNFPLLWACSSVTHCSTHMCELQDKCLRCGAAQMPICDSSHYGRCVSCGASLAWRSALFSRDTLPIRQLFISMALGRMIALGSKAVQLANPDVLTRGIRRAAEMTHNGSVKLLAKSMKVEPKVLASWAYGRSQPKFSSFLELCYRLGMEPLDLLDESPRQPTPRIRSGSLPLARPSFKLSPEKLREVEFEIRRNLASDDDDPITLKDLAVKYGTSVGHLRYQLPDICSAAMERKREIQSMVSNAKREDRLARATKVARLLFERNGHLPRRRIEQALAVEGLSIQCPEVRGAAYGEIERLKSEEIQRLRAGPVWPMQPSSDGSLSEREKRSNSPDASQDLLES